MADIQNDLALPIQLGHQQLSQSAGARGLARALLLLKAEHFVIKNETLPGATQRQLEDFLARQ